MRRLTGPRLLVATHNAGKLDEMRALFAPHGIEVVGAAELGLAEPPETEDSFIGNARIKARAAVEATGLPVLADDSGITVDGLNGAPGCRPPTGRKRRRAGISCRRCGAPGTSSRRGACPSRGGRSSAPRCW